MYCCPNLKSLELDQSEDQYCENYPCKPCASHFSEIILRLCNKNDVNKLKEIILAGDNSSINFLETYNTMMQIMVRKNNLEFIEWCLKNQITSIAGHQIDLMNDKKQPILVWFAAVAINNVPMMRLFQKYGADFTRHGGLSAEPHFYNGNALHLAVSQGHMEMVEYLCSFQKIKSQINEQATGQTHNKKLGVIEISLSMNNTNVEVLQYLLTNGANYTKLGINNGNALHLAIQHRKKEALELFVQILPRELIFQKNDEGKTPADLCQFHKYMHGTKILTDVYQKEEEARFDKSKQMSDQFLQELLDEEEKAEKKAQKSKEKSHAKKQAQREKKLQNILKFDINYIDENSQDLQIDSITVHLNEQSCQNEIQEFMSQESEEKSSSSDSKLTFADLKRLEKQSTKKNLAQQQPGFIEEDQDSCIDPQNLLEESKSQCTAYHQSEFDDFDSKSLIGSVCTATTSHSFLSRLTVHSRGQLQNTNNHWQDRAIERGSLNASDSNQKQVILQDLKNELNHGGGANVRISQENPNKICITTRDTGLHFILMKQNLKMRKKKNSGKNAVNWTMSEKQVYVPITVLAPGMKFE